MLQHPSAPVRMSKQTNRFDILILTQWIRARQAGRKERTKMYTYFACMALGFALGVLFAAAGIWSDQRKGGGGR